MEYKYKIYLKNRSGEQRKMKVKALQKTARDIAYDIIKAEDDRIMFETLDDGVYVCVADSILEFDIKPI